MRRRQSLLSKIIVGVSAAILLIDGAIIVPTSYLYRKEQVRARVDAMALLSRALAHPFAEQEAALDDGALLAAIERRIELQRPELGEIAAFVFARDGTLVAGQARAFPEEEAVAAAALREAVPAVASPAAGLPPPQCPAWLEREGRLAYVEKIGGREPRPGEAEPAGYLVLSTHLAAVTGKVANHVLFAMGLLLLILLSTGVITISALYYYVLRPLGALTQANRALVDGDEQRALVPPEAIADDELGDVIRSRNEIYKRMLEYQASIREKNEILRRQGLELKRWAHELERRVREKSEELVRASERLLETEKLAATGRLAAGLAHELNNPLASIAGYAEDLLELAKAPELRELEAFRDFPSSLETIEQQAYRCKRIIRQLLSFARPAPLAVQPLALGPIVEEVLPLVEHKARGRKVALELALDPKAPRALVDRSQLQQVLVNLIENAFDAIQGPGTISVSTRTGREGTVAVEVRDTGCGIPEENRSRIFDPFFTTKPVGSGTGLGLTICRALVSRMHGWIEVQSEVGKGAAFTVWLPAVPEVSDGAEPTGAETIGHAAPSMTREQARAPEPPRAVGT